MISINIEKQEAINYQLFNAIEFNLTESILNLYSKNNKPNIFSLLKSDWTDRDDLMTVFDFAYEKDFTMRNNPKYKPVIPLIESILQDNKYSYFQEYLEFKYENFKRNPSLFNKMTNEEFKDIMSSFISNHSCYKLCSQHSNLKKELFEKIAELDILPLFIDNLSDSIELLDVINHINTDLLSKICSKDKDIWIKIIPYLTVKNFYNLNQKMSIDLDANLKTKIRQINYLLDEFINTTSIELKEDKHIESNLIKDILKLPLNRLESIDIFIKDKQYKIKDFINLPDKETFKQVMLYIDNKGTSIKYEDIKAISEYYKSICNNNKPKF